MIEKFLELPQRQRTTSAYEWIGTESDRAVFQQQASDAFFFPGYNHRPIYS
jgi:hypothetical protein